MTSKVKKKKEIQPQKRKYKQPEQPKSKNNSLENEKKLRVSMAEYKSIIEKLSSTEKQIKEIGSYQEQYNEIADQLDQLYNNVLEVAKKENIPIRTRKTYYDDDDYDESKESNNYNLLNENVNYMKKLAGI